ncbi:MAG: hypothetical protein BGP12_13540 [Rhodospirillales bacterium 70-18]|nr:MAG: hypothetical protein BGP12_13540 [Rhodospirillales bacterium 70-18]
MCFIIDDDQRAPLRCARRFPLSEDFPKRSVVLVLVLLVDFEFAVAFRFLIEATYRSQQDARLRVVLDLIHLGFT